MQLSPFTVAIFAAMMTFALAPSQPHWFLIPVALAAEAHLERTRNDKTSSGQAIGPFVMRPGVVVNSTAGRLYMMNPDGGIDAVQIDTGKLLWTTKAAANPLTVFDEWLVAEAEATSNAIPIVLLDTNGGGVVSTIALPLFGGVAPSISDGLGVSSSVEACVLHDGLLVWWTVNAQAITGIARPTQTLTNSGAALIDLTTREVTKLAPDQAAAKLGAAAPPPPPRLSGTEGLYMPPRRAGEFLVSIKLGPASAGQRATLKRWRADSGAPLPDVDLGPEYAGSAVSDDGGYFLVTKAAGSSGAGIGYTWAIYEIGGGTRIAELHLPQSVARFFVWQSLLIYVGSPVNRRTDGKWIQEPLEVRALNLNTGSEIWKRPLRDTSYHGPYPPHT